MIKIYTLVLIVKDDKMLLGKKKRGFGEGWWNGFGGKVLEGETVEQAALREVQEESGLILPALNFRGVIHFSFDDDDKIHETHIFEATEHLGEPIETEEMMPRWFHIHEIPYQEMWPADRIWLPIFLEGKSSISGKIHFTSDKQVAFYELNGIKN